MTTITESDLTAALREVHKKITVKTQPGEFTVKIYAEANDVSPHVAISLIEKGVESGLIVSVGMRTINGHATKVYRLKTASEVL
jgi:hypothetical protein